MAPNTLVCVYDSYLIENTYCVSSAKGRYGLHIVGLKQTLRFVWYGTFPIILLLQASKIIQLLT